MATSVLICDDSSFARKQMASALPPDWDVALSFASRGAEALEAIKAGQGDILFLDLNMPGLDGYEVLAAIRAQDLPTLAVVVSGDIQPEARARVLALGALEFLKKPIGAAQILEILNKYGIYRATPGAGANKVDIVVDVRDSYQEIANVAMGRAADLLARLLNVFVVLPVPKVSMLEGGELRMVLGQALAGDAGLAVGQGFIGAGVAGEALLTFNESSFSDIAGLMKHEGATDETQNLELTMDIAGILIGACLKGIADQLDIPFSLSHPVMLGRQPGADDPSRCSAPRWNSVLAIEMGYTIEGRNIRCQLLLLFTPDSLPVLNERVSYLGG